MKKNILPRPFIDETLIHPFREMSDVLSLSCVISDALERDQTMRYDMKPKAAPKVIIGPAITVKLTAGDIVRDSTAGRCYCDRCIWRNIYFYLGWFNVWLST